MLRTAEQAVEYKSRNLGEQDTVDEQNETSKIENSSSEHTLSLSFWGTNTSCIHIPSSFLAVSEPSSTTIENFQKPQHERFSTPAASLVCQHEDTSLTEGNMRVSTIKVTLYTLVSKLPATAPKRDHLGTHAGNSRAGLRTIFNNHPSLSTTVQARPYG